MKSRYCTQIPSYDPCYGNRKRLSETRSLSDLRLTARFLPFSPEASLLLASGEPPSFVFAAIRGGFSSLSLGTLSGCESIDSHPLLLRCQNTHVAQLRSVFVALHQEKIIKKRLKVLKSDRLQGSRPTLYFLSSSSGKGRPRMITASAGPYLPDSYARKEPSHVSASD